MRRIQSDCCARATSGNDTVAPRSSVINSRRLIGSSFHRRKAVILPDCRAWPVYRGQSIAGGEQLCWRCSHSVRFVYQCNDPAY
jgi:hypothetical protein